MAKISARGATDVARLMAVNPHSHEDHILVMCSDGRILMRTATNRQYKLLRRNVSEAQRTELTLRLVARQYGLLPVIRKV